MEFAMLSSEMLSAKQLRMNIPDAHTAATE
jgi:hypothetical protein